MQNDAGPGDIPEWKAKLSDLTPAKRVKFAESLGVTDRTVKNWADGKARPNDRTIKRVLKALRHADGKKGGEG